MGLQLYPSKKIINLAKPAGRQNNRGEADNCTIRRNERPNCVTQYKGRDLEILQLHIPISFCEEMYPERGGEGGW